MWIIADSHAGQDPASDDALCRLIETAAAESTDLLFLGDLFVVWLGEPRFWTHRQEEVMRRIARARRVHRRRTTFIVGNRDYLITPALRTNYFDAIHTDETVLDIGGVPTLVVHGDRTNPSDRAYATWYGLSRNFATTWLLQHLPGPLGRELAFRVEAKLRPTNRTIKDGGLPMPGLFALGRRAKALGAQRALIGHYHVHRVIDVPDGVPVIIAPAWYESRQFMRTGKDGDLVLENAPPSP
ncbi:MAG: hypothetical protein IPK13_22185 [Deltaproteobacteria bacterium]|nr:hypothetical protein [Deltaproteobacteria bacterium]